MFSHETVASPESLGSQTDTYFQKTYPHSLSYRVYCENGNRFASFVEPGNGRITHWSEGDEQEECAPGLRVVFLGAYVTDYSDQKSTKESLTCPFIERLNTVKQLVVVHDLGRDPILLAERLEFLSQRQAPSAPCQVVGLSLGCAEAIRLLSNWQSPNTSFELISPVLGPPSDRFMAQIVQAVSEVMQRSDTTKQNRAITLRRYERLRGLAETMFPPGILADVPMRIHGNEADEIYSPQVALEQLSILAGEGNPVELVNYPFAVGEGLKHEITPHGLYDLLDQRFSVPRVGVEPTRL